MSSSTLANPSNLKYDALIENLKNDIKESKTDEEKVIIYIEFLENYMMPKEFWLDLLQLSNKQDPLYLRYTIHPIYLKLLKMSPYYFMYTHSGINEWANIIAGFGFHLKVYDQFNGKYTSVSSSSLSIIEECLKKHSIDLMLPHQELKQYLLCYEKDRFSPISKDFVKYVEKMQQLFLKIKASESDSPLWFNLLKEANDLEYLKQNVENFLLKNLSNQKLWKIYINYLKEIDPKEMLQVYSKYCRCFLEDEEMKEKYKNEMEIYGPIFVKWKKAFDFENVAERVQTPTAEEYFDIINKRKLEKDEKPPKFVCPKVDLNKFFSQDWSLPKPIIRYIASQIHSPTSEKLLQSCKYFLKHNSVFYCYKATFVHERWFGNYEIKENSFLISISSLNSPPFNKKNIYISNVLIFHDDCTSFSNVVQNPCSTKLSEAIKNKIFQCDAKFIDIKNQNLSEKEFKFLVGHGNVKYLVLDDIHIFVNGENDDEMALEEIFEMTPKLEYVSISNSNLKMSNTFSKLEFTQKLIYFSIGRCSVIVNVNDYCTFLKKYAAPFSRFSIDFEYDFDETLKKDFEETIKNFVNDWKPADEKPRIQVI
uniref:Uncharacterized protein n=1 Tax=Panagrolaimus davidi TaxID=227884 RepID=A0A914QBH1_9BILA